MEVIRNPGDWNTDILGKILFYEFGNNAKIGRIIFLLLLYISPIFCIDFVETGVTFKHY